jgi:hypothetical protein
MTKGKYAISKRKQQQQLLEKQAGDMANGEYQGLLMPLP